MKAEREGAGVQGHALSQIINFSPLGDPKRIYASRKDEPFLETCVCSLKNLNGNKIVSITVINPSITIAISLIC